MTDEQIKHMVDRFLSWKLPANFNPDNGISAVRPNYGPGVAWEPSGTNLLDHGQATAMVRHMLEGLPLSTLRQPGEGELRELVADAFLVEWRRGVEHWVDVHADEVRAVDQAKKMGGECIPLFRRAALSVEPGR